MIHIELTHILSSDDAASKIRDIVSEVARSHEPYVITVDGKPSVAVVHVDSLEGAQDSTPATTSSASSTTSNSDTTSSTNPVASISTLGDLAGYAAMNEAALKSMQAAAAARESEGQRTFVEPTAIAPTTPIQPSSFAAPSMPPLAPEAPAAVAAEPAHNLSMNSSSLPPLPGSNSPLNDEPTAEELMPAGGLPPLTGMQALQPNTPPAAAQAPSSPGGLPPLPAAPSSAIAPLTAPRPMQEMAEDPSNSSPLAG